MAEELEPTEGFDFEMMGRKFFFRNLTGFSERNSFETNAANYAKSARLKEFQAKLLEGIEDQAKLEKYSLFLKTRQIDDWKLAYRIEHLSVTPKLSTLEAIMLTRAVPFVEVFNQSLAINMSRKIASAFNESIEAEKKD